MYLAPFTLSIYLANFVTTQLLPFLTAYVDYQSLEDWTGARDILRCNPNFHHEPRYDCVILNYEAVKLPVASARLQHLVRCILPSRRPVDIALVHMFKYDKWRPRTFWDGCEVRDEEKNISFLRMDYVVRGALLARAFEAPRESLHYIVDTVDYDMFLRVNNYS